MPAVVLPVYEETNPFAEALGTLATVAIPLLFEYKMVEPVIQKYTDVNLKDFVDDVKTYAPQFIKDNQIDFNKVQKALKSSDPKERKIAQYLWDTRKFREDFSNLPIFLKIVNASKGIGEHLVPSKIREIVAVEETKSLINQALSKENLPESLKTILQLSAERLDTRPDVLPHLLNLLSVIFTVSPLTQQTGQKTQATQQEDKEGLTKQLKQSYFFPSLELGDKLKYYYFLPTLSLPPETPSRQEKRKQKNQ